LCGPAMTRRRGLRKNRRMSGNRANKGWQLNAGGFEVQKARFPQKWLRVEQGGQNRTEIKGDPAYSRVVGRGIAKKLGGQKTCQGQSSQQPQEQQ